MSADVSPGYEVPHAEVGEVLRKAALDSGLKEPFVHVRELGDFSVLYRVAGMHQLEARRTRLLERLEREQAKLRDAELRTS